MVLGRNTPRETTVIQRPPISRVTARARESFPGRLIIPNIQKQSNVPSVNIIPPPAVYKSTKDTGAYLDLHDSDGPERLSSEDFTLSHHLRHFSVSSYATQYTQRTQSTLQAIPTRVIPVTKQHRHGKPSFENSTGHGGQTSTTIHFLRRTLIQSSCPGADHKDRVDYEELDSQVTEPASGFQYAVTPSVGAVDLVNVTHSTMDLQVPLHASPLSVRQVQPSPAPTAREKRCICINLVGGVKFFEELTKRFKIFFRAGRNVGEWRISMKRMGLKRQKPRTELSMNETDLYTDREMAKAIPTIQDRYNNMKPGDLGISLWGPGEKTLRIKNNGTGSCVFMVTTVPGKPQEIIEIPLPLTYLHSELFVHSKGLINALEEWNKHFQNPPAHWVINFVPKAYLRRGWHLAEEVAEYLWTYGLNTGVDSKGPYNSVWRVEYEAIGHKACLVDESGEPYTSEGYLNGQNAGQTLKIPWSNEVRERHPSRCWERREGWDGCRGLVIGLAL